MGTASGGARVTVGMLIPARRSLPVASMALLSLAVLVGCTATPGASGASASNRPVGSQVAIPSPSEAAGTPAAGAVPDEILQKAITDAATQAGVDPAAVTVVSAEATTWNDGSLGCPEPGKVYTQALVPGYKIVLEAGGRTLDYHASETGSVKLCEGPGGY